MNPNEPAKTETKTVYMNAKWETLPTSQPGYIAVQQRTTTYNDGRVVREVLNDDGSTLSQRGDVETDPDQAKKYADAQRTAQTQTDQAERKVTRTYRGVDPATGRPADVTEYQTGSPSYKEVAATGSAEPPKTEDRGGRHYVWKPNPNGQGGQWEDVGPSDAAATPVSGIKQDEATGKWYGIKDGRWVEIPGGPGSAAGSVPVTGITQDKKSGKWFGIQGGKWVEVPGGPGMSDAEQKPKYSATKQDETTGKWHGLTPGGTWEEIQGGPGIAPKAPERMVDKESGQTLERGADGTWRPIKTEGVSTELSGAAQAIVGRFRPDPRKPSFGLMDLQQELLEARAKGEITNEEARKALAQVQPMAQAEIDRITGIEATQRSVFGTNVTQRGQDLNDIQGRRSAATSAQSQTFQYAQKYHLGPREMRYLTEMQRRDQERWGGMRDVPREQPYPMTQGILGIGLPGGQPGAVRPGAPAAPGAPLPSTGSLAAPFDMPGYVLPTEGVGGIVAPGRGAPGDGTAGAVANGGEIDPRGQPPADMPVAPGAATPPAEFGWQVQQPAPGTYGVPPEWQQQGGNYLDYLRMMDPPPLPEEEEEEDPIAAIMAQSPLAGVR